MKILIIDNAEPKDSVYNQPLAELVAGLPNVAVTIKNHRSDYHTAPDVAKDYDAIIISGVPRGYGFNTIHERHDRMRWLHQIEKPVLGICLGHQNIGTLFGADMLREVEAEKGIATIDVLIDDPIFTNFGSSFAVTTSHRGSIGLPKDFKQLASSNKCQNQVMKHTSKPIYGVQFHPEFGADGIALLKNFVDYACSFAPFANLQNSSTSQTHLTLEGSNDLVAA